MTFFFTPLPPIRLASIDAAINAESSIEALFWFIGPGGAPIERIPATFRNYIIAARDREYSVRATNRELCTETTERDLSIPTTNRKFIVPAE